MAEQRQPRQPVSTVAPTNADLPLTKATRAEPDLRALAAEHTSLANALDDEGRVRKWRPK